MAGRLDELDFPTEEEKGEVDGKVPDPPKIRPGHYNLAKDVAGLSLSDASKAYYAAWVECGYDPKKLDAEFKIVLDKLAKARGVKKPEEKARTPPKSQKPQQQPQRQDQMVPYKPGLVTEEIAKLVEKYAMPHAFLFVIDGKPYVSAGGLTLKSVEKGIAYLRAKVDEDPDIEGGFIAHAELMPTLTDRDVEAIKALQGIPEKVAEMLVSRMLQPFTGTATANPGNCRNARYMREMAETRAKNRAMRSFVAYGWASVEELPPEMTEDEKIAKAKNVTPKEKPGNE